MLQALSKHVAAQAAVQQTGVLPVEAVPQAV